MVLKSNLLLQEDEPQAGFIWVMPGPVSSAACLPAVSSCPLDSSQAAYSRFSDAVSGHLLLSATLQAPARPFTGLSIRS